MLCINMMVFQNHPEMATKEVQFLVFSELHFKLEVADFKKQIFWENNRYNIINEVFIWAFVRSKW